MATYDLAYPGAAIDAILNTAYFLQEAGYIFQGSASEYSGTPSKRVWLIAPAGFTGLGLSSAVPQGSFGICLYNGSAWVGKVINVLTLDSAPTRNSQNGVTSGGVAATLDEIAGGIMETFASLLFDDETASADLRTKLSYAVKFSVSDVYQTVTHLNILAATTSKAGLMSAEDKAKVDSFLTNLRSLTFADTTASADQATQITETLKATIGGVQEVIDSITLLAATSSKAGLLSAADKAYIDALPATLTSLSNSISGALALMQSLVGYYVCDTAAGTAAKTVAATGYSLTNGGCIRIKMTAANTAANVTLNINSTGAKALYYDGAQASSTNTWEAGEVLEVYYDGTQYQCASGGGGKFATGEKVGDVGISETPEYNSNNIITSGAVFNEVYTTKDENLIDLYSARSGSTARFTVETIDNNVLITCVTPDRLKSVYWNFGNLINGKSYKLKFTAVASGNTNQIVFGTASGTGTGGYHSQLVTIQPNESVDVELYYIHDSNYPYFLTFGVGWAAGNTVTVSALEVMEFESLMDIAEKGILTQDDIVNNTLQGGVTKVFSAEQGKLLAEKIDGYNTFIYDNNAYSINGWIDGNVWNTNNHGRILPLCVTGISKLWITATSHDIPYNLLRSFNGITNGATVDLYDETLYTIQQGTTVELDIPEGCNYIAFRTRINYQGVTIYPFAVSTEKTGIESRVSQIESDQLVVTRENVNAAFVSGEGKNTANTNPGSGYGTDYIDVEAFKGIEYLSYFQTNCGINCYDENYQYFFAFVPSDTNPNGGAAVTGDFMFPFGTKYIKVYSKSLGTGSNPIYVKGIKYAKWTSNDLYNRINDVASTLVNGGYKYLADSYGIDPTLEDNGPALQSLVNTVNENGGGIIELPVGTFYFKSGIIWKSNVGLIGQGVGITNLIMNPNEGGYSLFSGDYVSNIMFSSFSVDGSAFPITLAGKAFFCRYITDAVFEDILIKDTTTTSLGIDFLDRVKIINVNVINGGRGRFTAARTGVGCSGIGIGMGWSGHQENFVISNCICDGCWNNGIFVEDQGRFNGGGGTVMADGSGQVIANNICRNGKNCGISVWGGKKVSITGNICYNNGSSQNNYQGGGFQIGYYGEDVTIIGNQSIGNYYGFKLSDIAKNTSHIILSNNEIRANTAAGVIINTNDLTNKLTVKGNILNGNVKGIIISGNTEGLILRDNDISNTTDEDITISGTHTNAVIKGNTYMGTISSTATYSGETTWVEQLNI